jgi:hypothetical protein
LHPPSTLRLGTASGELGQEGTSPNTERALGLLIDEAMQHSTGVVLTLDEAHVAHREDLGALGAAPTQVWPALRRSPVKAKSITNADLPEKILLSVCPVTWRVRDDNSLFDDLRKDGGVEV